jgi:hypothetical protein
MDGHERDSNRKAGRHETWPIVGQNRRPPQSASRWSSPARWAAGHGHAVDDLLMAFDLLAQRGTGSQAWAAPFRHDPIAFLLDTVSDAANLWRADDGQLLYQNRAAAALAMGRCDDAVVEEFSDAQRRFERRCLRFTAGDSDYILEVIREISGLGENPAERGRG